MEKMSMYERDSSKDLAIIKYGSATLANLREGLNTVNIERYAGQVTALARDQDWDVVVVTSGAELAGQAMIGQELRHEPELLQLYASVGIVPLMNAWQTALKNHYRMSGQILLTGPEMHVPRERDVLLQTFGDMLDREVIPVVNANDPLWRGELKADNDQLSLELAKMLGASVLLLMTDQRGLMRGKRLERDIPPYIEDHEMARSYVEDKPNQTRRGGFKVKVDVACAAAEAGIDTWIAKAGVPFTRVLGVDGKPDKPESTHFHPFEQAA